MTMLRGQSRETSVLRLKDATFPDAKQPVAIMWCGGFGSADWFHNHIENLTFDRAWQTDVTEIIKIVEQLWSATLWFFQTRTVA